MTNTNKEREIELKSDLLEILQDYDAYVRTEQDPYTKETDPIDTTPSYYIEENISKKINDMFSHTPLGEKNTFFVSLGQLDEVNVFIVSNEKAKEHGVDVDSDLSTLREFATSSLVINAESTISPIEDVFYVEDTSTGHRRGHPDNWSEQEYDEYDVKVGEELTYKVGGVKSIVGEKTHFKILDVIAKSMENSRLSLGAYIEHEDHEKSGSTTSEFSYVTEDLEKVTNSLETGISTLFKKPGRDNDNSFDH